MADTGTIAGGNVRERAQPQPPTRISATLFAIKVQVFRARRAIADLSHPVARLARGEARDFPFVVAEHRTLLWTERSTGETRLQQGKVHNLREAARRLDGAVLAPGTVFSFWNELGRASRANGFVQGRMLQEGCLVPAVGGGLCQLSNALYEVALRASCEIVERHAHSRVVPGSQAAEGRDATVAWNYVDLRFKSGRALMLRVVVERDQLRVALLGKERAEVAPKATPLRRVPLPAAASCATCGQTDCHRHEHGVRVSTGRTAFLVDEYWPEFDAFIARERAPDDVLCLPLDGRRWARPQYGWTTDGFARIASAPLTTLRRSLASRKLAAQGAARQTALLAAAERLAERYAATLGPDVTSVCVTQSLLQFLWKNGHLGGRGFRVLMTRLPMAPLQARLDEAAKRHPDCATLADFRAPPDLVAAESEALAAADAIVTPHAEIASLFGARAIRLEWWTPSLPRLERKPERLIAFPGPTVGRKGAYELREAAQRLDVELLLFGSELEGRDYWNGVRMRRDVPDDWRMRVAAVVQPSFVEERPRALIAALAAGVPVIATQACGIPERDGLTLVPSGDVDALTRMIESTLPSDLRL